MLIVTTKVQQADNNQNRNKRRTTSKGKTKKQQPFNKILATEMTEPPHPKNK